MHSDIYSVRDSRTGDFKVWEGWNGKKAPPRLRIAINSDSERTPIIHQRQPSLNDPVSRDCRYIFQPGRVAGVALLIIAALGASASIVYGGSNAVTGIGCTLSGFAALCGIYLVFIRSYYKDPKYVRSLLIWESQGIVTEGALKRFIDGRNFRGVSREELLKTWDRHRAYEVAMRHELRSDDEGEITLRMAQDPVLPKWYKDKIAPVHVGGNRFQVKNLDGAVIRTFESRTPAMLITRICCYDTNLHFPVGDLIWTLNSQGR